MKTALELLLTLDTDEAARFVQIHGMEVYQRMLMQAKNKLLPEVITAVKAAGKKRESRTPKRKAA